MNAKQARAITIAAIAAKAFRNCRKSHEKSRAVASYLARQFMLSSGQSEEDVAEHMPAVDQELDKLFNERREKLGLPPLKTGEVAEPLPVIETEAET